MSFLALAYTLQDAFALADARGPGSVIAFGQYPGDADIIAPSGLILSESEADTALGNRSGLAFISVGNHTALLDVAALAPILELAMQRAGIGFISVCLASPEQGRTVYHGNLFQDGRLACNLRHKFSEATSGRVALIPQPTVAQGPGAVRRAVASAREQGYALALIDSIDLPDCASVASALQNELLAAGPAWLAAATSQPQPAAPSGPVAILSGALDRQTLYQLGAARAAMPFLQLDPSGNDTAAAIAWGAAQTASFIIATSAPPDRLAPGAPAAAMLAEIAAGLEAAGARRFLITGNDTAAACLNHLGVKTLTAGASQSGLRWFRADNINFALKPSGFGTRNLFQAEFEPQIRLNATAECVS